MTSQEFRTHQWTPNSAVYYNQSLHSVISVDFERETIKLRDHNGKYCAKHRSELTFTLEGAFDKWKDLPEKVRTEILRKLNAQDIDWIHASQARQAAIARRDYREAQRIKELMEHSLDQVAKQYIKECGDVRVPITALLDSMTPEQRSQIQYAIDENFFLADMIETNAVAINSILDSVDQGTRLPLFDSMIESGKAARKVLNELDRCSSDKYQDDFGDIADELKRMIRNKVIKLKKRTVSRKTA